MKKYLRPVMEILIFNEEDILTTSGVLPPQENTYAARNLNDYMNSDSVNASSVTTIDIEKIITQ